MQDVRYAFRSLLATRGLTAAAILSLALGIGANTVDLQRRQRAAAAAAAVYRSRPARDPVEPFARPRHRGGLVLHRPSISTSRTPRPASSSSRIAIGSHMTLTGGRRAGARRHDPHVLEPAAAARRAARASAGCSRRADDEGAPGTARSVILHHGTWMRRYRRRPRRRRPIDRAQRPALPDRRGDAGSLHAAARGDEHARRRRRRRDHAAAAARPEGAAARATARTTTSWPGSSRGVTAAQAQAEMDALTVAAARASIRTSIPPTAG